MSEDVIKKIFSEEKVTTRGTNNEIGTGIGLFITREIAEKENITIQLNSIEGKGTTFTLIFGNKYLVG